MAFSAMRRISSGGTPHRPTVLRSIDLRSTSWMEPLAPSGMSHIGQTRSLDTSLSVSSLQNTCEHLVMYTTEPPISFQHRLQQISSMNLQSFLLDSFF